MKRSDINFWSVMLITLISIIISLVLIGDILSILMYWWVLLMPGAIILTLFQDTKLFKWYTAEVNFKCKNK